MFSEEIQKEIEEIFEDKIISDFTEEDKEKLLAGDFEKIRDLKKFSRRN